MKKTETNISQLAHGITLLFILHYYVFPFLKKKFVSSHGSHSHKRIKIIFSVTKCKSLGNKDVVTIMGSAFDHVSPSVCGTVFKRHICAITSHSFWYKVPFKNTSVIKIISFPILLNFLLAICDPVYAKN